LLEVARISGEGETPTTISDPQNLFRFLHLSYSTIQSTQHAGKKKCSLNCRDVRMLRKGAYDVVVVGGKGFYLIKICLTKIRWSYGIFNRLRYNLFSIPPCLIPLCSAYHLSLSNTLKVAVIEKDPRYAHASAMLSVLLSRSSPHPRPFSKLIGWWNTPTIFH
jgi:hypothetical protein